MRALTMFWVMAAIAGGAHAAAPPAFTANCQTCHRADGGGLPGQFPRIAGRIGPIAATAEGRTYLIQVLLHGMAGKIIVDGKPIMGVMPAYNRLSNAEIAATLNHAATLGETKKIKPFTAAEIARVRAAPRLNAVQVKAAREALVAAQKLP